MSVFFDIFENYGWLGIVLILVCMVIFILLKKFGNKITGDMKSGLEQVGEKLTEKISQQNDNLVNTIIDQQKVLLDHLINKEIKDNDNHNNMLNERMGLAEEINVKLKDIMHIHKAQRAFILEFHNSNKNLSGVPFAKYSCNYEWFDKGMLPLSTHCMNMTFSTIAKVVQDVLRSKNQQMIYTDMEKLEEENPSLMSLFKNEDLRSIIYTGLYDNKNTLIGLLVLEYRDDVDVNSINLNQLNIQGAELTSILNIRYKYID